MAEDISALADGELATGTARAALDQLLENAEERERWMLYHAQADAMRFPVASDLDDRAFLARFERRLEAEPVLPARGNLPRRGAVRKPWYVWQHIWLRFGMPGTAMAAAVAVVGWMTYPYLHGRAPASESTVTLESPARPTVLTRSPSQDYLLAHQQFAPSSRLYGVVPYVRTAGTPALISNTQGAARP